MASRTAKSLEHSGQTLSDSLFPPGVSRKYPCVPSWALPPSCAKRRDCFWQRLHLLSVRREPAPPIELLRLGTDVSCRGLTETEVAHVPDEDILSRIAYLQCTQTSLASWDAPCLACPLHLSLPPGRSDGHLSGHWLLGVPFHRSRLELSSPT
eukprot:scaffold733_cov267-Pinguiococcus_pyrenoidosus.AAC.10